MTLVMFYKKWFNLLHDQRLQVINCVDSIAMHQKKGTLLVIFNCTLNNTIEIPHTSWKYLWRFAGCRPKIDNFPEKVNSFAGSFEEFFENSENFPVCKALKTFCKDFRFKNMSRPSESKSKCRKIEVTLEVIVTK